MASCSLDLGSPFNLASSSLIADIELSITEIFDDDYIRIDLPQSVSDSIFTGNQIISCPDPYECALI